MRFVCFIIFKKEITYVFCRVFMVFVVKREYRMRGRYFSGQSENFAVTMQKESRCTGVEVHAKLFTCSVLSEKFFSYSSTIIGLDCIRCVCAKAFSFTLCVRYIINTLTRKEEKNKKGFKLLFVGFCDKKRSNVFCFRN